MADVPEREEHANPALADTAADTGRDTARTLQPGDRLGRYTILEIMGIGGMGVVYAAHDEDLDRKVAIKLLRASSDAELARARLLREARSMARLRHANVITVYEAGEIDDRVFVAMELVEGVTAAEWLAAPEGPRDWRAVLEVFLAAGRGLAAAHAASLVHRDFKPGNVLIDRDGRVVVTDFGLARPAAGDGPSSSGSGSGSGSGSTAAATGRTPAAAGSAPPAAGSNGDTGVSGGIGISGALSASGASGGSSGAQRAWPATSATVPDVDSPSACAASAHALTQTGAVLGTPAYMAPEQHRGSLADMRSDQFSFCVALYEGLYGQRPFRGHSSATLHAAIVQGQIAPAPRRPGKQVPQRLRRILLRGLRAEPDDRFPSMPALLAALERVARPWPRALLAAGGAVLLSLAVLLVALGMRGDVRAAQDCKADLDGAWDEQVAAAVRAVLARTPEGSEAFAALAARLDAGRSAWLEARTRICEADREAPDRWSFHQRMGCLLAYREQLGALTELVRAADTQAMDFAVSAADELPDPGRCVELAPAHPRLEVSDDPARTAAVERVRTELAQAAAAFQIAKLDRALELAESALAGARGVRERGLELTALFRLAETHAMKGDKPAARRYLREAEIMAEELDDADILAEALTLHAALETSEVTMDQGAVRELVRRARIAVGRMREPGRLLGWLRLIEAYERVAAGDLVAAEAAYGEARHLYAEHGLDIKAARADLHLGLFLYRQGRTDESRRLFERGLAVMRTQLSALSYDVVCLLDLSYLAAELIESYDEALLFRDVMVRRCPRPEPPEQPAGPGARDLVGRVVDEAGQPVAGAEVVARAGLLGNGRYALRSLERYRAFVTRAGADGSFTLPAERLGESLLVAGEADVGRSFPVLVEPGAGAGPTLTLRPFGSVRGRVESPARAPVRFILFVPQAGAQPYRSAIQVPVRSDGSFAVERLAAGRYQVASSEHEYRLRILNTLRWTPLGEIEVRAGEALERSFAPPGSAGAVGAGVPADSALEVHVHNRFDGVIPRAHLLVFPGRAVPTTIAELETQWQGGARPFWFAEATPEAGHGRDDTEHAGLWHRFSGLPGGDLVACTLPLNEHTTYQPELGYPRYLDVYCVAVPAAERDPNRPVVIQAAPMRRRS